jgi:hypothetical protein
MGKGPRRINPVSIGLALLVAAAVYVAVKFLPVYLLRNEVDSVLDSMRYAASELRRGDDRKEKRIIEETYTKLLLLDIDEDHLEVYFDDEYETLNAEYTVFVEHPLGEVTTLEFHRHVDVRRLDDL